MNCMRKLKQSGNLITNIIKMLQWLAEIGVNSPRGDIIHKNGSDHIKESTF